MESHRKNYLLYNRATNRPLFILWMGPAPLTVPSCTLAYAAYAPPEEETAERRPRSGLHTAEKAQELAVPIP